LANIPAGLKYTKTHEWLKVEGDTATTGITDFAQHELSDIVYVDVSTVGKTVKQGDPLGTIEAVKAVADIYAPATGTVIEANPAVKEAPDTVNKDPYGAGWLAKMKLSNPAELAGLMDAPAYVEFVKKSEHH
jgi:glycine cleavage system H protein